MSRLGVLGTAVVTALAGGLLVLAPPAAQAANVYHVTTTADGASAPCTPAHCSFRDALDAAESTGGTVVVPAGHYVASTTSGNGVFSPGGKFTVRGAGAGKTVIDGNALGRTFALYGDITFTGVTVTGGVAPGAGCSCGGGIQVRQGGALTLVNSTISGNSAPGSDGGGIDVDSQSTAVLKNVLISHNTTEANGAGIHLGPVAGSTGTLVMTNVTFQDNTAAGSGGGLAADGSVTATNVTFAGNVADRGGAISAGAVASVHLNETTIADNIATTTAPGIDNQGPATAVTARNTIIADSAGVDCARSSKPAITSYGHNLELGKSCGFTNTGDHRKTQPKLASLAKAGGNKLPVLALSKKSPAVNAGDNASCTKTDERGLKRPSGPRCDIGAYELQLPKPHHR